MAAGKELTYPLSTRLRETKRSMEETPSEIEGEIIKQHIEQDNKPLTYTSEKINEIADGVQVKEELPNLPYHLREFAFKYATEYRTQKEWGEIFHRSTDCIRSWLSKEDVICYIKMIRRERFQLMAERLGQLELKAYSKLLEILDMPLTVDTADVIRNTIHDILIIKEGLVPTPTQAGKGGSTLIQINQNREDNTMTLNTGAIPPKYAGPENMDDLRSELNELNTLVDVLGDTSGNNRTDDGNTAS